MAIKLLILFAIVTKYEIRQMCIVVDNVDASNKMQARRAV